MIRATLQRARPAHGILGEEFGASGEHEWRWIVDPIDGTKNYVRGIPVYATLIALTHREMPVLGVVSAPSLARRWWASRGEGAFLNGSPITVSAVAKLSDAQLSYNNVLDFADHGYGDGGLALTRRAWRTRGFGDFWSHVLVAEGAVDVAAEPVVAPWDLAALQVIVEEAGGRFTDFEGRATYSGGSAVSTNGLLHDEVLAILAQPSASG
jgi:histidinol-phosphatase